MFGSRAVPVLIGAVLLTLLATATTIGLTNREESPASASFAGLPPHQPRLDLPIVLDGNVFDADRVGPWIVIGGDFTQVQLQDGTIKNANAFAYNINSGLAHPNFFPNFGHPNGSPQVWAVERRTNDEVFIGGSFHTVNGVLQRHLAKFDLSNGSLDTDFAPVLNGPVRTVAYGQRRLFIGGEFETANNLSRLRLAELDPGTGDTKPFTADITESTRPSNFPYGPKALMLRDDGVLVVAHRGNKVDGKVRRGLALVDLSTNEVTGWQTNFWDGFDVTLVDADISPDGSTVVVVGDGGDFPFMGRDSASAFAIADINTGGDPKWIARNFDSTYAVAVTDAAVFVGGHFCWVENSISPEPWPGDGEFTNSNSCFGMTPAGRFAPYVSHRDQLAALDPATGKALVWDPGSDGLIGIRSLQAIGRGLLVGHDGDRFGRNAQGTRAWAVGRHAFLDINTPEDPAVFDGIDVPNVELCAGQMPTIVGTGGDDVLDGTPGNDIISAGDGDDVVRGHGGDDLICGHDGKDVIDGGAGNDQLYGGDGRDRIFGGDGNDTLYGGLNPDALHGQRGRDVLYGQRGSDRLNGGAGADSVLAGAGRDRAQGGMGGDDIAGGGDADICAGWAVGRPDNPSDALTQCE